MAIRRKRKNILKTSQAAARRQKIERRKLLLENLEDRRLLAGIPQLAGIQTNDGQLLNDNDVVSVAPRELVFGFNQAADIDADTLGAIQILQSGKDGTFNRATTTSDLNTGGDVQVLFTAIAPGIAGNDTQVIFTKSDHGNASGPFVTVDVDARSVTLDLNTHSSNSTTALGIVNAINSDTDASSLLTAEITSGDSLADVAAVEITYSPVVLAGSNDVVIEPGYVGLGDSAREVVFRFKETLADESYQVIIDGSSPLALKDVDGSVFQDGEDFELQFELELGAQVTAVVPQPVIRDSAGALNQLRDVVHVYFNDDDLDEAKAEDPAFYQLIYTRTTVDANDDVLFTPISVDYDAQADLAALTFSAPLTQLIDPVSGTEIKTGVFRLRVGTDEVAPPRPLAVDLLSDAGSSFDDAKTVGRNIVVQATGDAFSDGQSFDVVDDGGVRHTFEFDTGDPVTIVPGAITVAVTPSPSFTSDQVAGSIVSAINGAGFQVRAALDGSRITLVNARTVEHADLVITGDASDLVDGQVVEVVTDSGRIDVLEVETGFLLAVPAAGSDPATEITDAQTFTIADGTSTVTFEFDLQGNGVTSGNVAIGYAGGENPTDMAEKVALAINNESLGLTAQALGSGGVHLGGTESHTLDTDSTAATQSGQPGVGLGNVPVPVVPSAAVTSQQLAAAIVSTVNSAGLVGVSAQQDGTRVFFDGVRSVASTSGIGGMLFSAPASIEQFRSIVLSGEIEPQSHALPEAGSVEEPGHRDIRVQSHLNEDPDSTDGTSGPQFFSFPEQYGTDPQGNVLLNAITEEQKQRAREILEIYGQQLGITFVEHDAPDDGENDQGFKIVTGDMRALDPTLPIGVGGVLGVAGDNMAIMDLQDFQQAGDDAYGGPWFQTAMHEIGHLLGLGHTDELPQVTVMNDDAALTPAGQTAEPVYPGDHDLVHGRQLYRPDSKDIDLFRVPIDTTGILRIETFAERQQNSSLLDTVVTLYREVEGPDGPQRELVARNDNYFSDDSRIELSLNSGTYFIGVSAAGNDDYNPAIEDSGYGGKTQGRYDLQLTFRPNAHNAIEDLSGIALDGDGDGENGGVFNFWFQTAIPAGVTNDPDDARTLFVDKLASGTENGALAFPFGTLGAALAEADPGDVIRLIGNPGADGDMGTLADNVAYQFGYNRLDGAELEDGNALLVPQGVTVMIDAGAIIKSRRGRIGVGSSSPSIDRSGSALQVLGTPHLVDQSGNLLLDADGEPIPGSVYFTSINDGEIGADSNPDQAPPDPRPGDWGGLDFRHQIDSGRVQPFLYSDRGVFLDYVNQADIAYGGGVVPVDGTSKVVSPIHLADARPTITFNSIHQSAESAISANPNSFQETTYQEPTYQGIPFTSDYSRIGPAIHSNTIVDNSINGLFVRIATPAGNTVESLTVAGRFDDTDIVHVVTENLEIEGTPGGPLLEVSTPPTTLVTLDAIAGGSLSAGTYNYRIVYVDAAGNEGFPSAPTRSLTTSGGSIQLDNLPSATTGFTARRIYRSDSLGSGPYTQVAEINATNAAFLDDGSTRGGTLVEIESSLRSRLDASLVVDPGTIVKLDGSRIEAGIGAQVVIEGVEGREVVFTSIRDSRYGTGGTFDTSLQGEEGIAALGDWSGIYASPMSRASIDHALFLYGGGVSRIEGNFAGFNTVELHQATARIANSVFQFNADGSGGQAADRLGRGTNDQSVIFVRGAQPVILNNTIRDNLGSLATEKAAAISINANSLSNVNTSDPGRMTGKVDQLEISVGNQGPLIRGNRLENNEINGMEVRGATLTTESVWDDTDIVHVLREEIHVSDFHTSGGLRLESSGSESLVVKLEGDTAGFRADGRPLEIDDRIGGTIQIVGQPGHSVVLTSLADCSVGAGFTSEGFFQPNTIPLCEQFEAGGGTTFPTGPEVDNGLLIDNDVDVARVGHFEYLPFAGGGGSQSGVTVDGRVSNATNANFIFDYTNYVDVGSDGTAVDLAATTITQPPTLIAPDVVTSAGNFAGANAQVNWTMQSHFDNGEAILFNTLTLTSANDQGLGDLQFITYLDEDVQGISDDILYLEGTPGEEDFRAFTLDGPERFGFSQGGTYLDGPGLVNATYTGWAADIYSELQTIIVGAGTTYSVAGNIDTTDLPSLVDPDLDPVYGPGDVTTAFAWNVDPAETTATIVSFLELVPQDPTNIVQTLLGTPGDWNSIELSTFSHDRNVGVVVEREGGVDQNKSPETAQHLGALAPHEKSGDDNQRLGFQVHGDLSQPGDVDVYSFAAPGGTEVWLDIDATRHSLDTVVELIDVDGTVLARSDNSINEEADPTLLLDNNGVDGVFPLVKSAYGIHDHWTTNPRDAGMRVVLPGQSGSVNTYQVRVRSSSDDLADLEGGTTSGSYQLQVRLGELDELPGSTIQFADIRYATNAIEILGQTVHSPLSGEIGEVENGNTAQQIGNLLTTDRATLSIAGDMADATDVDLFEFGITYDRVQTGADSGYAVMLDLDYADGLARANTSLNVFDAAGQLILTGRDSNIAEDRPGPLRGIDMQDLSRGTVGPLDPMLGTVELPGGTTYQVAVTTDSLVPEEMDQFIAANPANANLRLEPITSVGRIVEDHISETTFSTFEPPQVPVIVGDDGIVPYHIGDVVLFVSQDSGLDQTTVSTIDGFTGAVETTVGSFNRDVGDVDIRGADNRMYAFTLDLDDGTSSDGQAGNYVQIDTGDATLINPCDGTLQDDNVQTNHEDPTNPGNPAASDVGMHYDALTYASAGLLNLAEHGFMVGHRPANAPTNPLVTGGTSNILYRFDPECGTASSSPQADRTGTALVGGAGTNIVERGILDTTVDSGGTAFTEIIASEATDVQPDGTTTTLIADGTRFLIEHDGNLLTPAVEFEFNGGPEVYFNVDPANGIFVRDGDTFALDGQPHEFNTGPVLVVNAQNGSQITDGDTISITDKNGQLKIFEFDSGSGVGPGSETIDFTTNMSQVQLVATVINSINGVNNYAVQASTLSATSNRITLVDDSTTTDPTTTATNIEVQGSTGGSGGAGTLIEIEESFDNSSFSDAVVTRFNQVPAITVSPDGSRINFSGSLFGSFTSIINRGVFTDQLKDGLFGATAVQVPFLASDTAEDIAQKMTTALNGQTIPTTQNFTIVDLDPPASVVAPIDAPLRIGGAAPGGDITGLAFIGNTLYAVSNNNNAEFGGGGLFIVNDPLAITTSAQVDYVETSAPFLQGIDFEGLAAGPVSTEDGLYQEILFGMDSAGELYAFDTDGVLQPLFVDGATSVQTGLTNITGLQFSTREENLWATTGARSADAGHGLLPSYDGVRTIATPGGTSLHFGRTDASDIDLPGGVHGSFETRTFSLENYSAADQPVLYFNYFADTEGAGGPAMFDSFRVFVGDDSGNWDLLTTNNSDPLTELDLDPAEVQETFDGVDQWRQVRADLSSYAGVGNLRLRFDFSAAGEMNTGHEHTTGEELRTIPARDLRDGQVITIGDAGPDGRWGIAGADDDSNDIIDDSSERLALGSDDLANLETFEIDLGFTLVAPSGKGIHAGDLFTIDYGSGISADFEFISPGSTSSVNAVEFLPTMSAAEVAQAIQAAILAGIQAPVQTGTINGTSEPNDILGEAIPINLNNLSGRFEATGGEIGDNANLVTLPDADVDLLSIEMVTGTRIQIDIDSENYSSNTELLNSFVRVFDSTGQQLASNDNAAAPGEQPSADSYLDFTAPRDGTYYIGVSGAGNNAYDPNVAESGAEGSTGSYDLLVTVQTSGGYVQRHNHRVQLPGAVDVTVTSVDPLDPTALVIEGSPGIASDFAVSLHAGMNQDAVANSLRRSLAGAYAGGNLDVIKGHDQVVRIIGHSVVDAGPLGLTFQMPGDQFGDFNSNLRGQNNAVEGVYIDDIVIGFAERGEMVTGAGANTNFVNNTRTEPNQVTSGSYQLELRGSSEYVGADEDGNVILVKTFDSNDRLSQQTTIVAPAGHNITDGQTFTFSDGIHELVFEYDDDNVDDGVPQGNVEISFDPSESSATIAQRIRDEVNGNAVQSILDIRAASSDGSVTGASGDDRVNLFGTVRTSLVNDRLEVTDVTTDANLLRDTLLGSGITVVGDAALVGSDISAGVFEGGLSTIGLDGGIVLSTGDVKFAEGPNVLDNSSGLASQLGDTDLDIEFVTTTLDATTLEFQFESTSGDIFFDFVFASEEYNEFVGSQFNDVFGFFVDGINIALVPVTGEPISINTVNDGNPVGTGASNPQYFNNNDLDDGGQFLEQLGYDGFTTVFTAEKLGLTPGTHTLKLAISDVGDESFDSAVFVGAGSLSDTTEAVLPTGIAGEQFDLLGDQNLHRDQGQVLIHSNRISDAEQFGIVVDSSSRNAPDNNLNQGPTRLLREHNTAQLVPGITITNNILAANRQGGISFQGEANVAGEQVAAVPFGRIINNTIVGNNDGLGIQVSNNASPTILNNIVSNLATGIDIDASSETTVLGGTLYADNTTDFSNVNIGEGDFPLYVAPGDQLFVNADRNNFYPAAGSKAIDSSVNSLEERASLNTVKAPLGIAPSPILAPDQDAAGQERVDDPSVATPSGLGQNVFKDRGAIDRADFSGPSAILADPEDNDELGVDQNSQVSIVEVRGETTDTLEIQLVDGVVPIDPGDGIGIDDATVTTGSVKVFQDDTRLVAGIDYVFNYDATNDVIRLTALAGAFQQDRTYRIELANVAGFLIEPDDGSLINDGDTFQVTDLAGQAVDFEFDSGYIIQVPQAYTLIVPENGGLDITDGETFNISDDQGNDYNFELDRNGVIEQGNFAVLYTIASSADTVAAAIVSSLTDANIGLEPVKLGADEDGKVSVHVGTNETHVLDATGTSIDQAGVPVSVSDGDIFTVDDGSVVITFEFDGDGSLDSGGTAISHTLANTHEEIAESVSQAITSAGLGLSPQHFGDGLVHVGGTGATQIDVTDSNLQLIGQPGARTGFGVRIPSQAGAPDGLEDGQTFTIDDGTTTVTFEFDDDQNATAGNVVVRFAVDSTIEGVANELVSVIQVVGLGLDPSNAGNGIVELGGDGTHQLNLDESVLTLVGIPGLDAAVPVPFVPDESFDEGDMSQSIADAINGSDLDGVSAQARIDSVVVTGAQSVDGTGVQNVSGIRDLADNPLQPNQPDGSTVLTVILSSGLDYGDAPDTPYPSSRDSNGATHQVQAGYQLGASVDVETDANSNLDATGDNFDDGVIFTSGLAVGFGVDLTVTVAGITVDRDGVLDAWFDFDQDGNWSNDERVISQLLSEGANDLSFTIPNTALVGSTFARFRLSSTGTADATGPAVDGEVEDYQVSIGGNPWHNSARPLDVNNDGAVSPIDALKIITALNDGKAGQLPVPPTAEFSPPPFLDVSDAQGNLTGDGILSAIDVLQVINHLNNLPSGEGEGEAEGEPVGLVPLGSEFSSEHYAMAEASSIPQLSDFLSPRREPLEVPVVDAATDSRMDSRRLHQAISAVEQRQGLAASEGLDEVLQLIGEDVSETREMDGHDEYFARLRF